MLRRSVEASRFREAVSPLPIEKGLALGSTVHEATGAEVRQSDIRTMLPIALAAQGRQAGASSWCIPDLSPITTIP
jgi:hypothetical protein